MKQKEKQEAREGEKDRAYIVQYTGTVEFLNTD